MGQRIRAMDWSTTPLGPPELWPQSLKTAVRIMLTSRQPFWIGWGKPLTYLYNDPYLAIIGGKHPQALGQPTKTVWQEIWDVISPMLSTAMAGDEGTYVESQLLIMERYGYREETYYTFSYSPIPNDDGTVGGIICANTDDTARVIGDRQLGLLRDLAVHIGPARNWEEVCERSMEAMRGNTRDLPFAMIYIADPAGSTFHLSGACGIEQGHPAMPERIDETTSGLWPLASSYAKRDITIMEIPPVYDEIPFPTGAWTTQPAKVALIPIAPSGQTGKGGVLIAGLNPHRLLDDRYQNFLSLIGNQISTNIASAQAYEEERKRAEKLAQLDEAKTAFFSNVSHEFRTPLTLMLGPIEDMLDKSYTELAPATKGQLEVVHRNSLRLLKLVNTMLDFSRIEAGRLKACYEPMELGVYTSELASIFRSAMERAGLQLIVDCPPLAEPAFVDRDMWEKIVLNLLNNAFKFTLEGRIEVRLQSNGRQAVLTVRDTGVGIPEEEIPRVFDRFHRVKETRGRTHEGTGIGLALVQELVKFHSGTIQVESMVDHGSCFTVTIPLGQHQGVRQQLTSPSESLSTEVRSAGYVEEALHWLPHSEEDEQVETLWAKAGRTSLESSFSERKKNPFSGARPRIVWADDNADMREYVSRLLEDRFDVEAVVDGQAALDAVRANPPDLVLTDIMMPRLDGLGLLAHLRADPHLREIPIILLSARSGEESRVEGLQAGADDYLIKPFSARELMARVQTHVELSNVRKNAKKDIARSQHFLERLAQTTPDLLFVYDVLELRNVYINERIEPLLGYTGQQLQGIHDPISHLLHPDDLPETQDWLIALNRSADESRKDIECRIRHQNGTYRWFLIRATVFERLPDGTVKQIIGVGTDTTERKRAEEALRESEERFRNMAEHAPVMVWMTDSDGMCTYLNKGWYQFTGQNQEAGLGFGWLEASHPDDRLHAEQVFTSANREREPFRIEYRLRRHDGVYRWVIDSARPRIGESGQFLGYIGSVIDITERKEVEEDVRRWKDELEVRVQERTSELLASQAQLRWLASQLSLTEQRERRKLANDLHDYLAQLLVVGRMKLEQGKSIFAASPAGTRLVQDLDQILEQALTYSRTTIADLSPPSLQGAGFSTALRWLSERMQNHGLQVEIHSDQDHLTIPEDQALLLFQSVRELLFNVLKHAEVDKAFVSITTAANGDMHIQVQDHGKGMNVEALHRHFEPGHLGLFAVRERMEAIGGRIELSSAFAQGTTVTLVLPGSARMPTHQSMEFNGATRVHNWMTQTPPPHLVRPDTPTGNPIRILLVDDHVMMRKGLLSLLQSYADLKVIGEAGNGIEAVAEAKRLKPDIVIMDINMPKLNGIEATRQIVAERPATKVIGVSVNEDQQTQDALLKAGAVTYLNKNGAATILYQTILAAHQTLANRPADSSEKPAAG